MVPAPTLRIDRSLRRSLRLFEADRFSWLDAAAELGPLAGLRMGPVKLWVVTDGAYAKRPFVRPALELGAILVGRLRKDSALYDLPPKEKSTRRGRKRKYGRNRISLVKRAANRHGWIEGMEPHPVFHWGRANGWAVEAGLADKHPAGKLQDLPHRTPLQAGVPGQRLCRHAEAVGPPVRVPVQYLPLHRARQPRHD